MSCASIPTEHSDFCRPRIQRSLIPHALKIACVILLAVFGSGIATAQDSSDTSDDNVSTPGPIVEVDNVAPDQAIARRLTEIFESSGWFTDLNVGAENGIVTLTGVADNEQHQKWAADVAGRTQDVISVINKLTIDPTVDLQSSQEIVQNSLGTLLHNFLARSPLLIASLFVLLITAILAKVVGWSLVKLLGKRNLRPSLQDLIYQLSSIALWIVGLLTAMVVAFPGMTPSKALTVLGLGSVAIGFAFKDIFENFFAGMLILWRYPFDRGDFITCDEITGKVERITIRNTMIRGLDGELSVVPNATLLKNNVDVLTSQPQRRVRIDCGVAYDVDIDAAREVIREAVASCKSVQAVRTTEVFAKEFASSSVNYEVAWWTGSKPTDIRRSRDEVVSAIKRALDDAGIEIPFPYRTLTFKDASVKSAIKESLGAAAETN
ncbi:mechanosensitive ion channel family protein [Rhodopirellula sp. SWK7]|uniref:mechanosensitive ion channel family protein n=1 Tax=Rhodopirellula sp. SWK7 TaxID=595460 RepID=UPI0002BE35B9|nr:mechanosensitive ion channel family protein [Rhodopirellula sp. SWK7]EMI40583.1 mechanosensitive ion channel protein [Rhodopirellula sp. SWK7]